MKFTHDTAGILAHKADAIVVGIAKKSASLDTTLTQLDRHVNKTISNYVAHKDLLRTQPLHVLIPPKGKYKSIILVVTKDKEPTALQLQQTIARVAQTLSEIHASSAVIDLASIAQRADTWALRQAVQACGGQAYKFKLGLTQAKRPSAKLTFLVAKKQTNTSRNRALKIGDAIAQGVRFAKHLGEQPPNLLYPDSLAKTIVKHARSVGLKTRVLDHHAIKKYKMGGLLGVGQGSAHPPRLIVLQHHGARNKNAAPVVLVGKGITFDTGGNSLKPSGAMTEMKFDMCGAAGVVGTLVAAAHMKLPLNVAAVVPTAENMLAGNSFRPDDILTMMDGQTVEVLNTDAEGRLILADALTYAQRFLKPAVIVDAATLTGACLVALGQHRSGMCANDDKLAKELYAAGEDSADLCWRLPLDDAYDQLLESEIADMSNIGGGRNAGTITAACFLQRFVKVKQWAHLDIAGTAWQRRRASGRPVPLLTTWLAKRAKFIKDD